MKTLTEDERKVYKELGTRYAPLALKLWPTESGFNYESTIYNFGVLVSKKENTYPVMLNDWSKEGLVNLWHFDISHDEYLQQDEIPF